MTTTPLEAHPGPDDDRPAGDIPAADPGPGAPPTEPGYGQTAPVLNDETLADEHPSKAAALDDAISEAEGESARVADARHITTPLDPRKLADTASETTEESIRDERRAVENQADVKRRIGGEREQ